MSKYPVLVQVTDVEPLEGFVLRLAFSDGSRRDVDVRELLRGPIFEPLRTDPRLFRQVRVDSGTVTWPNGADIDPVVLHGSAEPSWKSDPPNTGRTG